MTIKEMYQYWFYQHYKSMVRMEEWTGIGAGKNFPYEERVLGVLLILGSTLIMSIPFYLGGILGLKIDVPNYIGFIAIGIIILLLHIMNISIFAKKNKWRSIIKKLDAWPKKKNRIGGWIVFGVDMLIFANMGFAIYVLSQSVK